MEAIQHKGFSFVRILQRCPKFTPDVFEKQVKDPDYTELLVHENGVIAPGLEKLFKAQREHDPKDIGEARALALHGLLVGGRLDVRFAVSHLERAGDDGSFVSGDQVHVYRAPYVRDGFNRLITDPLIESAGNRWALPKPPRHTSTLPKGGG